MIELSLAEAEMAMGCRPAGLSARRALPPITTDSRSAAAGQTFFALRGERFDGHDFIPGAVQRGVSVVVHSSDWQPAPDSPVLSLRVSDTTRALQDLAARVRRKWSGRVVAVTGSMGKTTTRLFTATLLAERYRVHQSAGNLNNQWGVPLTLLKLEPEHEVAVLELGMNHAGEIRRLAQISSPDVGLITNVAPVHLEFFADLEAVADAKAELLEELSRRGESGIFVFNVDDPLLFRRAAQFPGRKCSFGFSERAEVRLEGFEFTSLTSMEFDLSLDGERLHARVPFVGRHFLYNIAAAAAVGRQLGLTTDQIRLGIQLLEPVPGRGRIYRVSCGELHFDLWDDSYNSNPQAMQSVLQTLAALPVAGRRVAVLGDMLELGAGGPELHRQAGREAAAGGVDLLLAVGTLSKHIVEGALEAGFPPDRVFHFADSRSAGDWLNPRIESGDLVLVKGSRGIGAEAVVERLKEGREVAAP